MLLYLECRFSNSITTSSCDCNQILAGAKDKIADAIPVNQHANHKHLPEEFEKEEMKRQKCNYTSHIDNNTYYNIFTAQDFVTDIFHPPLG